jgi:myo-inositol-1(or 4)-monophosphatase
MMMKSFAVKMLGSVKLQLAYVACGRLDGYWEYGSEYGDYYDWLAGALIVREAGGMVTDTAGNPFTWGTRGVLAANETLSAALALELSSIKKSEGP